MISFFLIAATLLSLQKGAIDLNIESETSTIDPARSVFLTLTLKTPKGENVALPDLRDRVRGFSQTEDFAEEPVVNKDGSTTQVVKWKLIPEPCASVYKIAPFAVGKEIAGPIYFENPPKRDHVEGGMEIDPKKDLPPFSWKLLSYCLLALVVAGLVVWGILSLLKLIARKIKEHRMSPIERAWVELDRLLKKGLPGRGKYKDFYVELTMVVRRYVQRKYGISAPNLTTEEFLREAMSQKTLLVSRERLAQFLESADLVKFAGVEATPEMADDATESARSYLKVDTSEEATK